MAKNLGSTIYSADAMRRDGFTPRLSAHQLIGFAAAALLPAVFWPWLIGLVMSALGLAVSTSAMIISAAAIAMFLAAVCAPIMLRGTTCSNERAAI